MMSTIAAPFKRIARSRAARTLAVIAGGAAFAAWTVVFLLVANQVKEPPKRSSGDKMVQFDAPKQKPPPKKKAQKKKKAPGKTKSSRQKLAPPSGSSALAGFNFSGAAAAHDNAAAADDDALIGDTENLALTADTVDAVPTLMSGAPPPYPPPLKRKGVEGTVIVAARLDKTGRVTEAKLVSAQPPGVFDELALRAVKQYRFSAPTKNGVPVATWVEVPFEWELGS